jgi:lipopolysaccharide biosynthesis protein
LKKAYADDKYAAIFHYLQHGRHEGRLHSTNQLYFSDKRIDASMVVGKPQSVLSLQAKRVAVFVHIYYFELWPELRRYIQNLAEHPYDLFVNISESAWTPNVHAQLRLDFPDCKILITKNRGRDIGGYLALMGQILWSKYDVLCLIHTKKSPHLDGVAAEQWRKELLDAILGSKDVTVQGLGIGIEKTGGC